MSSAPHDGHQVFSNGPAAPAMLPAYTWRRPAARPSSAARRTVRRLGARRVKTAEVPVIFDPEMAATLVRELGVNPAGVDIILHLRRRLLFLEGRMRENAGVGALFEFSIDKSRGAALLFEGRVVHVVIL